MLETKVFMDVSNGSKHLNYAVILIAVIINALVLINAILHDPRIGYDAAAHLDYIESLAGFKLVKKGESGEFFSPPLPYVFPAALVGLFKIELLTAAKFAQYFNVLLSIGITIFMVKISGFFRNAAAVALASLLFLGILPVYYKTFAMVRGEPFVVCWMLVSIYYVIKIFIKNERSKRNIMLAGLSIGLTLLSRQWGIIIVPALGAFLLIKWATSPQQLRKMVRVAASILFIAFLVSGWFYIHLKTQYGSFTAFNRKPNAVFSFKNQPSDFYTNMSAELLFTKPVRPHFPNRFFPIYYAETWGDYWCYFLISGKNLKHLEGVRLTGMSLMDWKVHEKVSASISTNYHSMSRYLGRVNKLAIIPSTIIIFAFIWTIFFCVKKRKVPDDIETVSTEKQIAVFLLAIILFSFLSYLWFLILYPELEKGDTIKATYQLHIYPLLALLCGYMFSKIMNSSKLFYWSLLMLVFAIACHNVFAKLTHYPLYPVFWD